MEEIEKLKNILTENNVTEVRKIESCFEQINRLIEKIKWKGELKNIKRDCFVEGFLFKEIKNVMLNDNSRRDQMIVAGR